MKYDLDKGEIDIRHDARNWRSSNDDLAAWHEDFCKRASMADTVAG